MANLNYHILSELETMQYIKKIPGLFSETAQLICKEMGMESKFSIPYNGTRFVGKKCNYKTSTSLCARSWGVLAINIRQGTY